MCLRHAFVLAATFALSFTAPALAGEHWRIEQSAGGVTATTSGMTPIAFTTGGTLPDNAWVKTDANGRALLVRGVESIMLAPNSRVALPVEEVNGNTQVLQDAGAALYQIGKQQAPHFQVDTPYLAAVVKGTTFTVTVGNDTASVAVEEGLVEVATPDRASVEFVPPGSTGRVGHEGGVVVTKTDDVQGTPNPKANDRSAGNAASPQRVLIASAIGDTVIDIREASKGLASFAGSVDDDKPKSRSSGETTLALSIGTTSTVADSTGSNGNGVGNGNGAGNGIGNGIGNGVTDTAPDLGGNGNGNAYGVGNGNAGGNGNSNAGGNDNSNAGGNGNGNAYGVGNNNAGGNGNSNAGGNGKDH